MVREKRNRNHHNMTDRQYAQLLNRETNKTLEDVGRKLDKIAEEVGGMSNNIGDVAEDFFYRGLELRKRLGGVKFDDINHKVKDLKKNEYDIVLTNGKSVAVIEVKHKLHPNDVQKFVVKTIPAFTKAFNPFGQYEVLAGVAGLCVPDDSLKLAMDNGLFVLSQSGRDMKFLNSKTFSPKVFK